MSELNERTPSELAGAIRRYGYWQGPDPELDELVARAEKFDELAEAAHDLLNNVLLPTDPTKEDLNRIVRLDLAARL